MSTSTKTGRKAPDIRDRLVNFRICDVYIPHANEVLAELHGGDILQGRVLDLSDSGTEKRVYAVVEVEGLSQNLIVPMERILGVL